MTHDVISGGQPIHAPDNLKPLLEDILQQAMSVNDGKVADYIPALAEVKADYCALTVATLDGNVTSVGDSNKPFSIQSISKIYGLMLAIERLVYPLWGRVQMEPSGQAFNPIVQRYRVNGILRKRSF